jgi:hypothetical protein
MNLATFFFACAHLARLGLPGGRGQVLLITHYKRDIKEDQWRDTHDGSGRGPQIRGHERAPGNKHQLTETPESYGLPPEIQIAPWGPNRKSLFLQSPGKLRKRI